MDPNTGFYYLRARWYAPESGRFVTQDTFAGYNTDPRSLHKYVYTHADPVNGMDPSGHVNLVQLGVTLNVVGIGVNVATYAVNIITGNYVGLAENIVEDVASTLIPGGAIAKNTKRLAQWLMRGKTFMVGLRASSHALRHNMLQMGIKGCEGCAAHHLIPGTENRFDAAIEARRILNDHNVDINSFVNGVFLPTRRSPAPDLFPSAPHVGGHAEEHYEDILRTLRAYGADNPSNKPALYQALNDIRERLLMGELRVNGVEL